MPTAVTKYLFIDIDNRYISHYSQQFLLRAIKGFKDIFVGFSLKFWDSQGEFIEYYRHSSDIRRRLSLYFVFLFFKLV